MQTFKGVEFSPDTLRFFHTTQRAYLFGLVGHALLVGAFFYLQVPELAWFNALVSVPAFAVAMLLNRAGRVNLAFVVAFFELYLHQIVGVYYIGWAAGLQFWLIYLAALGFFNPVWKPLARAVLIAVIMTSFALLYLFVRAGQYTLAEWELDVIFLGNAISAIVVLAFLINFYSRAAHDAEASLHAAHGELKTAHAETRELLLNILPESIATRLTADRAQIADSFSEGSLIFCDLVGFTKFSSSRSAEEVVSLLNGIFYGFDGIVEQLGLEKIKTIGDGYMVASGVPQKRADHALAAVNCAVQMLQFLKKHNAAHELEIGLRIGISSGPVVAGVIGKNKFTYDIWGDTVNTASRMESSGLPGSIHISADTAALLGDSCKLEQREPIEIKGKGLMTTFFVKGIRRASLTAI